MDRETETNDLNWLNPDVLIEFIEELRAAGYNIGISQYIAAQDLILILIAQGEIFDHPNSLRNLLGPIFCSSPTEQAEFPQYFDRWINSITHTSQVIDGQGLETQGYKEKAPRLQSHYQILISLLVFLCLGIIYLSIEQNQKEPIPTPSPSPTSTDQLPIGNLIKPKPIIIPKPITPKPITPKPITPKPITPKPITPIANTQNSCQTDNSRFYPIIIVLSFLFIPPAGFLVWRSLWLWRSRLFLQRHTIKEVPNLQKISIDGCDLELFPTPFFIEIAQNLNRRIPIPSDQLDIDKTIETTLRQGGWLTPVYRTYKVLPEYIFLFNRTSFRDHQAKFVEEMIDGLKRENVLITTYFFDDDPLICFSSDGVSSPFTLDEIIVKYCQCCLVLVADADKFFSPISGELEPWVSQLVVWQNRVFLTLKLPVNWGYHELEIGQQFIILPATKKGLQVLSQRLYQPQITTNFWDQEVQTLLPAILQREPERWLDRIPPDSELIQMMLNSLQEYLGQDSFYWLCACAIFPELHWNITIYLGNVLRTESGNSLLEINSLRNLAQLPWFRYGSIPDWLRICLIETLTEAQKQAIRHALQALLVKAIQGPGGGLQLEIAAMSDRFLSGITQVVSQEAPEGSPLRDYLFISFMTKQPLLAVRVSDNFSRLISKRNGKISRRQFLQMLLWGGVGLGIAVVSGEIFKGHNQPTSTPKSTNQPISKPESTNQPTSKPESTNQATPTPESTNQATPTPTGLPMWTVEFETVTVDETGQIIKRDSSNQAKFFKEDLGNGITLEMVYIPGGSFKMGSPAGEKRRFSDESPQHDVNVPAFYMGRFEVTQEQYQQVMGKNPSNFKGAKRPVEQVSWSDAIAFCNKLSQKTGRKYRLPSEAEWEYACRAGTKTPFYFGETITTELANYNGESIYAAEPKGKYLGQTTEVGSFPPNAFGLYDMHGNVSEWCQDTWHDSYEGAPKDGSAWGDNNNDSHLLRGGSWDDNPRFCRSADRNLDDPAYSGYNIGFRVVCVVARIL
jgi:formylglycine-generating enzyme required for sulfatase activity